MSLKPLTSLLSQLYNRPFSRKAGKKLLVFREKVKSERTFLETRHAEYLATFSKKLDIPLIDDPGYVSPLMHFFEQGKAIPEQYLNPQEDKRPIVGRAWKASELRLKDFDDLHKLWFICLKELNLLFTQMAECKRQSVEFPNEKRIESCKQTMARIRQVLQERRVRYNQAIKLWQRKQTEWDYHPNQEDEKKSGIVQDLEWLHRAVMSKLKTRRSFRMMTRRHSRKHPHFH